MMARLKTEETKEPRTKEPMTKTKKVIIKDAMTNVLKILSA